MAQTHRALAVGYMSGINDNVNLQATISQLIQCLQQIINATVYYAYSSRFG